MHRNRVSSFFAHIPWLIAGAAIGLVFADFDQIPLLQSLLVLEHRSILTHGILLSLVLLSLVQSRWIRHNTELRLFAIGFNLANAVHLSFDLFPRAWWRHALIHVFLWEVPTLFSILWIALSIVICLHIALRLMRNRVEFLVSAAALLVTAWIASEHEMRIAVNACITLAVSLAVVLAIRVRSPNPWRA